MGKQLRPARVGFAVICYLVIRLLPVRVGSELMALVGRMFPRFLAKKMTIRRNLHTAFPDLDDSSLDDLTAKIIANFGRLTAETSHISSFRSGRNGAVLSARGALKYPIEQRGKAIYVSAHLGNWELIPIFFQQHDLPLTIVRTQMDHPVVDRRLMSLRRETGATYVDKSNALRPCIAALKRDESIALLVDQRVESGIEVDFFARRTLFTSLPARMALRFNCPIIPGEAVRVGPGQVQVVFHEPIWPGLRRDEDAERDLTQRMAKAIEESICRHPEQWFCNKSRWEKRRDISNVERPTTDLNYLNCASRASSTAHFEPADRTLPDQPSTTTARDLSR